MQFKNERIEPVQTCEDRRIQRKQSEIYFHFLRFFTLHLECNQIYQDQSLYLETLKKKDHADFKIGSIQHELFPYLDYNKLKNKK